MNRASSVIK